MPNNWKTFKLSEVTEYIGRGISPKYTDNFNIKVINQRCIRDNKIIYETCRYHELEKKNISDVKYLKKYDVLVNSTGVGTLGRVAQFKDDFTDLTVDSHVSIVRPIEDYGDDFFGYAIIEKQSLIESLGEGSTGQTELSRTRLGEDVYICLPESKKEREEIAAILSTIDDKIENNLAINKTLEEMAMALYKHWFVDFGPFQDGEFVESELGRIPKGWEVKRLDEIAFKRAETYKFKGKEKVVFVNTGDVLEGSFMHKNYMDVEDLPGQAKKAIYPEDILYSEIRPGNKRYAYVDFDSQDYVVSTKFMVIRNNELINNKLLYRILTRDETIAEFQNIAESRSGTFPQITFDAIGHIKFVLPNIDKQNEFQSIVGNWEEQQANNLKENQTLTQLRDTLLPKLISGEVRLKEFRN